MKTLNSKEIYRQSGERAGLASRNRDMGFVRHESQWFESALNLEEQSAREGLRDIWRAAYKQAYKS